MIAVFLQALLPGIRDMRTPFVAGLLWLLFFWILAAPTIEPSLTTSGFPRQVFRVVQQLGGGAAFGAITIVAYVVGVLAVTMANGARAAFNASLLRLWNRLDWEFRKQLLARQGLNRLRTQLGTTTGKEADATKQELETLESRTFFGGIWIRQTNMLPPRQRQRTISDAEEVLERTITRAVAKGANDEFRARGFNGDTQLHFLAGSELVEDLVDQLKYDPLDLLRAVDDATFQAFDRERSEREFRVAITPPVIALCAYLASQVTSWAHVGTVLGLFTFMRAAAIQSQESWRVVNQLVVKGLPDSVQRDAETYGQVDVRKYLTKQSQASKAVR